MCLRLENLGEKQAIYIQDGCKIRARECAPRRRRKVVRADVRIAQDVSLVLLDLNDVRVRVRTKILVG